jgi:hypothetical protein
LENKMAKRKILWLTPPDQGDRGRCGVSLVGTIWGKKLQEHPDYETEILHTDNPIDAMVKIRNFQPHAVIYNYHYRPSTWMNHLHTREFYPNIKNIRIVHDSTQAEFDTWTQHSHSAWQYLMAFDPTLTGNDSCFVVNRIIPNAATVSYVDQGIPVIGWQGFPAPHKGLPKIVEAVQHEFDEAIIRFHIPEAYFAYEPPPPNYNEMQHYRTVARIQEAQAVINKTGIKLEITEGWMSDQETINWLAQNTINCYFYDYLDGSGLSSSIDYALAARRPIAVTRSHQMRHCWNLDPTIVIDETSLRDIISHDLKPLQKFYENYSDSQVFSDFSAMFNKIGL